MNRRMITGAAVAVAFLVTGLHYEPSQAASSRACDAWARDYARSASRQGQVARRGLFGGLLGAGIGAATGGAAAGAAIGGASGPYQELMRGSALRTRSIGLPTGTAWRGAVVSASAEVHCAFGFAALAEAVAGMVLLQSDWPRCQRLMSYCILAARLGGILRFSVVITVPAPACLKSMM
jgi:hypothetical protein